MRGRKQEQQVDPQDRQVRYLRIRHGFSEPQARLRAALVFGEQVR